MLCFGHLIKLHMQYYLIAFERRGCARMPECVVSHVRLAVRAVSACAWCSLCLAIQIVRAGGPPLSDPLGIPVVLKRLLAVCVAVRPVVGRRPAARIVRGRSRRPENMESTRCTRAQGASL